MIINAARLLKNGDVVFVGVGQPNLACNLAKRTHAPDLVMIYEAGVIGAEPGGCRFPSATRPWSAGRCPWSACTIFSPTISSAGTWMWVSWAARRLTNTAISTPPDWEDYAHPKVRLPGSGGAQEIAAWANRCYIMTPHQKRRFPENVDFLTSAGYLDGMGGRLKAGLRGKGPVGVVTDIGYLEPDETGELVLTALHPGKTAAQAIENTGWALKVAGNVRLTEPVTEKELQILRDELDPSGIYTKSG